MQEASLIRWSCCLLPSPALPYLKIYTQVSNLTTHLQLNLLKYREYKQIPSCIRSINLIPLSSPSSNPSEIYINIYLILSYLPSKQALFSWLFSCDFLPLCLFLFFALTSRSRTSFILFFSSLLFPHLTERPGHRVAESCDAHQE